MLKMQSVVSKFPWICGLAVCVGASVITAARTDPIQENSLTLSLAAVLNTQGPTLAFTIINNSKTDIPLLEVGQDPCRVVVVKPNGEEAEFFFSAGPRRSNTEAPKIAPGQSVTQKINVFEMFGTMRLKEPGLY